MGRYFVSEGALQVDTPNGPRRIIECSGSYSEAKKVSNEFAIQIADALNAAEDDCLAPKMKEAKELREMPLKTESARMFRDLMATDLENEARQERKKSTNEDALKKVTEIIFRLFDRWGDDKEREWNLRRLATWAGYDIEVPFKTKVQCAGKKSDVEESLQYVVKHLVAYLDHLDSPVLECMYHLNKLKEWLRTGKVPEEKVVPS